MDRQRVAVPKSSSGRQKLGSNNEDTGTASTATPEVMSPPMEHAQKSQNGSKHPRDESTREIETADSERVNSGPVKSNQQQSGLPKLGDHESPARKRQRGDLPEVVSVSSSALPPLPFSRNQSAALTESSVESRAEPDSDNDEYRSSKGQPPSTPHRQVVGSAVLMQHPQPPAASSSHERSPESPIEMSPSSRTSGPSPLPPPPAPPSTPASIVQTFQDLATPRPGMEGDYELLMRHQPQHGVMENASFLEQEREAAAAAADTPAPTERRRKSGPGLVEDFSEWAVGDRYELLRILGRGSYGEVAQARDLHSTSKNKDDAFVAIKRITSAFEQEVDAVRLYREMHILRRLRGHECIIQLLDVVQPPTDDLDDFHDLYLVFEYVDTDLYKLIMSPQFLTTEHIQTFLYQMLAGLKYIHSFSVIHRDLKPANILLNEDCSLKICDFGLARIVNKPTLLTSTTTGDHETKDSPPNESAAGNIIDTPTSFGSQPKSRLTRQLTKHVVTRWYRAPELILIQPYSSAVDIWSLGCILAELLSMQEGSLPGYEERQPLFPGGSCYPLSGEGGSIKKDERLDQLSVIFGVIGTPGPEDLASIGKVTDYIQSLNKHEGTPFETLFPAADPAALDLLKSMLKFNPKKRCTVEEALEHDFLKGVRRKDMEKGAAQPLVGPDFLETTKIDLDTLKLKTYEEVLWYRDQNFSNRKL